MPISCCFYYHNSVAELKVRGSDISGSSFTLQDCLSFPRFLACLLVFCITLIILMSVMNCVEILVGIALNQYIAFDKMDTFSILILLVHEIEKSFHLLSL